MDDAACKNDYNCIERGELMSDTHTFKTFLAWPADAAQKLPPDPAFSRDGVLAAPGKPDIPGSSPAVFGGNATCYSPRRTADAAAL